jgi:F0F1-type ATP synthase assembly protein I
VATEGPSSPAPPAPRKRPATLARQISDVLELPFLLVASVAVGGGIGVLLDAHFRTSPVLALVLGVAGFAAGMRQLLKRLTKDMKDDGGA